MDTRPPGEHRGRCCCHGEGASSQDRPVVKVTLTTFGRLSARSGSNSRTALLHEDGVDSFGACRSDRTDHHGPNLRHKAGSRLFKTCANRGATARNLRCFSFPQVSRSGIAASCYYTGQIDLCAGAHDRSCYRLVGRILTAPPLGQVCSSDRRRRHHGGRWWGANPP